MQTQRKSAESRTADIYHPNEQLAVLAQKAARQIVSLRLSLSCTFKSAKDPELTLRRISPRSTTAPLKPSVRVQPPQPVFDSFAAWVVFCAQVSLVPCILEHLEKVGVV